MSENGRAKKRQKDLVLVQLTLYCRKRSLWASRVQMARRSDTMDKKRVRAETHAGKIMTTTQEVADAATQVNAACGRTERGANE